MKYLFYSFGDEINPKHSESYLQKTLFLNNALDPVNNFGDQTYMVMSQTRRMSKEQDLWFNDLNEGNGQKSLGQDSEHWIRSEGSVATNSLSRNQMTSLSLIN